MEEGCENAKMPAEICEIANHRPMIDLVERVRLCVNVRRIRVVGTDQLTLDEVIDENDWLQGPLFDLDVQHEA